MNETGEVAVVDRQFVVALSRGLSLLACFRDNRPLLTNGELAALSGLPCSSVSRLTHTLIKLGYLEYDSGHAAYRLGTKVLSLGYAMLGGMDLQPLIHPYMQELAERANSLVALATCEDWSMMCVTVVRSRDTQTLPLEVGAHVALDTSAMGRAYIASCSAAEQKKILEHLAGNRKRDPALLRKNIVNAINGYRSRGYCTSIDDWRDGVNGVAVPLYLKNFGRRMVLTCGGTAKQMTRRHIDEHVAPFLIKTASDIEQVFERMLLNRGFGDTGSSGARQIA